MALLIGLRVMLDYEAGPVKHLIERENFRGASVSAICFEGAKLRIVDPVLGDELV